MSFHGFATFECLRCIFLEIGLWYFCGIDKKGEYTMITKDEAMKLYYEDGLTLKDMCKYLDCVNPITAAKRLKKLGIDTYRNGLKKKKTMHGMSEDEFNEYLKKEYETKSMNTIAKEMGVSAACIRKYFVQYGIVRRAKYEHFTASHRGAYEGKKRYLSCGYVAVYMPSHPRAGVRKCVYEHDLVMEAHIGRYLNPGEVVHHIDGNKSNNDISNLMLLSNEEHVKLHRKLDREKKEAMTGC